MSVQGFQLKKSIAVISTTNDEHQLTRKVFEVVFGGRQKICVIRKDHKRKDRRDGGKNKCD